MRALNLIWAATTVAGASLPARQNTESELILVTYEEALEKYSHLVNSNTSAENTDDFAAAATCSRPLDVRVEWRSMDAADQQDWLAAVNCLMDAPSRTSDGNSLWEDLAYIHRNRLENIHGLDRFFPWHREFVMIYENFIRGECGYQGPLPWWDETQDAGHFSQSAIFSSNTFGALPLGPETTCVNDGVSFTTLL
jgi:tyrosinase